MLNENPINIHPFKNFNSCRRAFSLCSGKFWPGLEKELFFVIKSPLNYKGRVPFVYRHPGTDSTTGTPPFVFAVAEYLCRVRMDFSSWNGHKSIAFAGNSSSKNINGCWNVIWFFMLGYYIQMEFFNFSRIIIQPPHLNWFETGLRGDKISNWKTGLVAFRTWSQLTIMWAQVKKHMSKKDD